MMLALLTLAVQADTGTDTSILSKGQGSRVHGRQSGDARGTTWSNHVDHAFGGKEDQFQTYLESDANGRPMAIGVAFSGDLDAVFPWSETPFDVSSRMMFDFEHPCAEAIPFTHANIGYYSHGHPGGVSKTKFDELKDNNNLASLQGESTFFQSHIDIHFHLDSPEESREIKCDKYPPCEVSEEVEAKFLNFPEGDFKPPGFYADLTSSVPGQGIHWVVDEGIESDEFRYDYAPIYVSYDGKVTAWEIMATISAMFARLDEGMGESTTYDWPAPVAVQKSGYYPTKVRFIVSEKIGERRESEMGYLKVEFSHMEFRAAPGSGDTEDAMCPAVDCATSTFATDRKLCECGYSGRKFSGQWVVRGKVKTTKQGKGRQKITTACACKDYCTQESLTTVIDGWRFKAGARNPLRACTCMKNSREKSGKLKKPWTSGYIGVHHNDKFWKKERREGGDGGDRR